MKTAEKAKELVDKYLTASFGVMEEYIPVPIMLAKQCALIAVDELLLLITYQPTIDYWNEVKQEIEKL